MPTIFVICGCNGAGKTTSALELLPTAFGCQAFVNADAIAAGLSPLNPNTSAVQAGRLMLERMQQLRQAKVDFGFETTLASRSFAPFLRQAQNQGYRVHLLYFWLQSPELAVERVAKRVQGGGHDIPTETIYRRYQRGIANFFELYRPIADEWMTLENSAATSLCFAAGCSESSITIYNESLWESFQSYGQAAR
jgi:predicted ABC-type ATPase